RAGVAVVHIRGDARLEAATGDAGYFSHEASGTYLVEEKGSISTRPYGRCSGWWLGQGIMPFFFGIFVAVSMFWQKSRRTSK
ncbi:MAG TPA: hypothetical protein VJ044_01595, partial [Candidatus Hodarchaeales archaeon]|nr:hypothetical protein [Candidatus Hodarchaeales archaeon]